MLTTWPWLVVCPCPLFTHSTVYILAQAQTPEEPEEATDTMKQPPAHLEAPGPMAVQEVTSHRRSRPPATTKSLLRCYSDEHVMTGLEEKDEVPASPAHMVKVCHTSIGVCARASQKH